MDFGAPNRHFQVRKIECPITFLKICVRALQNEIKIWVFIELSWFLIPDNIQNLPNRILEKYWERSTNRSPSILSNFEIFKNWSEFSHFLNNFRHLQNSIAGLRFGLRSEYFSIMWLGRFWILSGIKNQLDSIKTQIFILLWSALTQE